MADRKASRVTDKKGIEMSEQKARVDWKKSYWDEHAKSAKPTQQLAQVTAELDELLEAVTSKESDDGTYEWAKPLRGVRQRAQYWIDGGRKVERFGEAIVCIEQAVNAWKNACYSYAEKCHNLEAELAKLRSDSYEKVDSELKKLRSEIASVDVVGTVEAINKGDDGLWVDVLPTKDGVLNVGDKLYLHPQAEGKVLVDTEQTKLSALTSAAKQVDASSEECEGDDGELVFSVSADAIHALRDALELE